MRLLFLTLFLVACSTDKKYKMTILKTTGTQQIITQEKKISAKSDSLALVQAVAEFDVHKSVFKSMLKYGREYLQKPESFLLYDEMSNNVDTLLGVKTSSEIRNMSRGGENKKVDSIGQSKIFGKVTFGLSEKEFNNLKTDYFQKIGLFEYMCSPAFYRMDSLYWYSIKSLPHNATDFDTRVKKEWKNLVDVIQNKYGPADDEDGYPSFSSLKSGYIFPTHTWHFGDKIIEIGVGDNESQYYSRCLIYNKRMMADERNKDHNDEQLMKQKAAEKF